MKTPMLGVTTNREEWLGKAINLLQMSEKTKDKRRIGLNSSDSFLIDKRMFLILRHMRIFKKCDQIVEAAKAFRVCGQWQDASEAMAQAADVLMQVEYPIQEAALFYCDAGELMEKVNPSDAEPYYGRFCSLLPWNCVCTRMPNIIFTKLHHILVLIETAISLYCDDEKFQTAGRIQRRLAEWNKVNNNYERSIIQFQKASAYFLAEAMMLQSNQCRFQAALLLGSKEVKRYKDASQCFLSIGESMQQQNILRFRAKECFFRSGLLELAMGILNMEGFRCQMEKIRSLDPQFASTRECQFLENLFTIRNNQNIHDFADHVYFFELTCDLDAWCLDLLQCVRSDIEMP